jgi:UDP-GlcNAc:undecaprenyl-phosphate GlcNAc-1-phosphate transferase
MGGLAIYAAFIIALLVFHGWRRYLLELVVIILSTTWLAFIGFLDDRLDLRPWIKFPAQAVVAVVMILVGVRIELFNIPAIDYALTFLWIVGIINAINFLDNMDGLAAGLSGISAIFIFFLAVSQGQDLVAGMSAALCGSAAGFLIYNFNPATTFMGDMGSMVLGFILAVVGIKLRFSGQDRAVSWAIPILVLGLPIFDTTLVVFTRLREGRSPLQGGKDHTSHRLVAMGLSHRAAVVTLYGICVLLGASAFAVSQTDLPIAKGIIAAIAVLGVGMFIILEVVRVRQQRALAAQKQMTPTPSSTQNGA